MYNRFNKNKPIPISTHPLEQSLDQSYASLQSQMEFLDKMQRIFGQSPTDPVIRFQMNQLKKSLGDDIRRIAFTQTDIHHIQELIGADIVKAQIINARKTIDEDKNGGKPIVDLVNDEQFADAEQKLRYQQLLNNPLIKQAVDEYIQIQKFQDPRRVDLQQMYMNRGMPYQQAYNKSAQNIQIDREQIIEDQLASILARIPKNISSPIIQQEEEKKQREEEKLEMRRDELRENIRDLEQQQKQIKLEQRLAKKAAKRKRYERNQQAKQELQFPIAEEEQEQEEQEEQEEDKQEQEHDYSDAGDDEQVEQKTIKQILKEIPPLNQLLQEKGSGGLRKKITQLLVYPDQEGKFPSQIIRYIYFLQKEKDKESKAAKLNDFLVQFNITHSQYAKTMDNAISIILDKFDETFSDQTNLIAKPNPQAQTIYKGAK